MEPVMVLRRRRRVENVQPVAEDSDIFSFCSVDASGETVESGERFPSGFCMTHNMADP